MRESGPIVLKEGIWVKVNIEKLEKKVGFFKKTGIFERKRRNPEEEKLRVLILEALEKARKNPDKYFSFETLIPATSGGTLERFEEQAKAFDGYIADWIQQALVWGQMIVDGARWKDLCFEYDWTKHCRVVKAEGGYWLVGNYYKNLYEQPITEICFLNPEEFERSNIINYCVPLIAR